ncbi:MAG: hypothetical protein JW891_06030 [Candidatus Lokiarchaeota archaeon]|nr:hypothetical protein [Candidatus Lokiarchaeota archaeon]
MDQETGIVKDVLIICPKCQKRKKLQIPVKIINKSKQLTTVSIPAEICCEHGFQAFIDKNFKVRGYQQVDFDFSKLEYLEKEGQPDEEISELEEIIKVLRNCVDDNDVLGSALFNIEGKVLYSSLSTDTLFNTIREFETRKEEQLAKINRIYLVLENRQMVCSKFFDIQDKEFILTVILSEKVKIGMGNLILRNLEKELLNLIH